MIDCDAKLRSIQMPFCSASTVSVNGAPYIAAYVGLDVHKETLAVAIAAPERLGDVRYYGSINNEAQAVRRLFQKFQGLYGNTN